VVFTSVVSQIIGATQLTEELFCRTLFSRSFYDLFIVALSSIFFAYSLTSKFLTLFSRSFYDIFIVAMSSLFFSYSLA
jgi:hypothetical protein